MDYNITAEFYDHVVPYRERGDVDFYVDEAVRADGPVLEIASGTGRILIPTARRGVNISGLEFARPMIDICRRQLAAESDDVRQCVSLIQGDMRSFEIDQRFALVTMPFRPFQHLLSVDDQVACLTRIRQHLRPRGRLVFDVFNPNMSRITDDSIYGVEGGHEPEFTMPDGRMVLRSHRMNSRDLLHQTLDIDLIYQITHTDGRIERFEERLDFRYFHRYEVEHLLARCGFEIDAVHSDFNRTPYGTEYPGEMIFIARPTDGA